MVKLKDYSGDFLTDFKLEDFEHSTLADASKFYSRLLYGLDGIWYRRIREMIGNEAGLACDVATWDDFIKYEVTMIKRHFKIRGNDLTSFLKVTQLCPWFQLIDSTIEVQGKKEATLTVKSCPILESQEIKEDISEGSNTCEYVCPRITIGAAHVVNPGIKVTATKLPPRNSREDICCQWKFQLE